MTRNSERNHQTVAQALIAMDESWIALFRDVGLSDLSYSDLFTHMWLSRDQVLHKTDLYTFMPSISRRTAVKYVQQLIDQGLLQETGAEEDKRVRRVTLTAPLIERLERFYDETIKHFSTLAKS
ncbi:MULTISPECIES: winged helix DNA-binding protein [unclassified Pseudomonas]|uniref:winged helix DNA-binding protein n=1 Tax=unclassified Pseudomonas TaxID=196821 RepID=UPI000C88B888|nr:MULTISPECIES: winged helix DNA-binding protein [unclassified Pseudomonas]PMX20924.1 MarR family transcriptional regulator [Pseudomonas sp. GW460-12]PMX31436.1 MarR family transcriptional regulator [Pseudomonas sp. MPR-R2A4]PMX38637.1 MarR family transcriptional regulator [Pseudomonas sp. MPR-R2A7]PMX52193.1 MarR family transcriptional regulator [Pseudomonas sp. MPR-R2A6]PMX86649.1 MarR family transcriptional regulator [Pseudomonas sp. MPR-R2A3]